MNIKFSKMHGLGNDFMIIDNRKGKIKNYKKIAQILCHRNFGVGADGIILLSDSTSCDFKYRIFNADGSEAEMCGNGMRCLGKYIEAKNISSKKELLIETLKRKIKIKIKKETVQVDMGEAIIDVEKVPFIFSKPSCINEEIIIDNESFFITTISMGNPHAIIFCENLDLFEVEEIGSKIENHKKFPKKTNVHFVEIQRDKSLKARFWERGVGETYACGTGACACFYAAILNKKNISKDGTRICMKGGNLFLKLDKKTNHILKEGDATFVFEGEINL